MKHGGISKSPLNRRINEDNMTRNTNNIKSHLTEANKIKSLHFCIYMIDQTRTAAGSCQLNDSMNVIYLDEKWFYNTEPTAGFYFSSEITSNLKE